MKLANKFNLRNYNFKKLLTYNILQVAPNLNSFGGKAAKCV